MTKDISIPAGALEAGAIADFAADHGVSLSFAEQRWATLTVGARSRRLERQRAAFLAMVGNWEGMKINPGTPFVAWEWAGTPPSLILPLEPARDDA